MKAKPWAFDGFVLNDGEDYADADWVSVLRRSSVLPVSPAQMARRQGRRPLVSGIERPGERLFLQTMMLDKAMLWANRRLLLQKLNPEDETPKRLVAADYVPPGCAPEDVLLAMGPWDVYADSAGAWHLRDLLDPDNVEADVTGAVHFEDGPDGERARGLAGEDGTANLFMNPSLEIGVGGWLAYGSNTIVQSSDYARFGNYSCKATYQDNTELARPNVPVLSVSTTYTASAWIYVPEDWDGGTIYLIFVQYGGGSTIKTVNTGGVTGQWVRVYTVFTIAADNVGYIRIKTSSAPTAGKFIYVDAVQCELDYPTSYCDGSLGAGYSWSGAAHASTSTRTATEVNLDARVSLISENDTLTFLLRWFPQYDADTDWPDEAILFDARGASDSHRIYVEFEDSDDKYHVYVNGADRFQSSVQTFDADEEQFIALMVDFGNDSYGLNVNGSADGSDSTSLSAPTLTDWNLGSDYAGANQVNAFLTGYAVINRVMTATEMAVWAAQGSPLTRWVDAICERVDPWKAGGRPLAFGMVSTLALDDDVRWRSRDGDVAFWRMYDDTGEITVDVDTDDDVYPILRITPRTMKTAGYAYSRWVPIKWLADSSATTYPVRATLDTAALTPAKMQADGDDLRVTVGGVEVDRWLADMDTAATKIWFNLDFQAAVDLTLKTAILIAGDVDEIEFNEVTTNLPSAGTILIGSEAFVYTAKSDPDKKVSGVTRAANGTSAAAHAVSDDAYWIQHDVRIIYGDSTVTAPVVDDDYEPAFELDLSTNTSWVYEEFGEDDGLRAGQWSFTLDVGSPVFYGGNQGAAANPWIEIGSKVYNWQEMKLLLYNSCGIVNVNFTNGEKRVSYLPSWKAKIKSSADGSTWVNEYTIPAPIAINTWESWSRNEPIASGKLYVALWSHAFYSYQTGYLEAADCTVTLDSTYTPDVTVNAEQASYDLSVTIENETVGDLITLTYSASLDETLEVDTNTKTITDLADGSSQMQALTLVGGARRDWLRLVSGENVLTWSDTGTVEVDVDILWDRRYFE